MLEKSSQLVIAEEEKKSIQEGVVPERLLQTWELSIKEFQHIIQTGDYVLLPPPRDTPPVTIEKT